MTKQVRTVYRSHRRAAWVVALALVGTVAAITIPIASGAGDKTFTLAISPVTCLPASSTTVRITNTAETQALGSIQIYFPLGSVQSAPPGGWTLSSDATRDIVARDNLNLARGATTTVTVPLKTTAQPGEVSAVGKQANKFNDTTGTANLFERDPSQTSWPQLGCAGISGRVYHDRDQSGAFTADPGSPTNDVKKPGWKVTLQRQTGATTFVNVGVPATTDANGLYNFAGLTIGSNYRLCVAAPSAPDPDNAVAWAVRQVAAVTLVSGCSKITSSSPDSKGISVAPLTAAGKTNQDFAVVPVTVFDFEGGDTAGSGNYVVAAGGDSTKVAQHYTQETFTSNGHPYFIFAPINACPPASCGQLYLLEDLKGTIAQSALGPAKQISLVYDDSEPFTNFQPMPYCLQDPRGSSPTDLLTDKVLPTGATSCIVEGRQTVRGDDVAAHAFVDFEYFVYSSYDGGRGMG